MSGGEKRSEDAEARVAAELVLRIRNGDQAAEAELVERYSRGLRFLLRRLTRDPVLAEDIHQETFRAVLVRLRKRELEEPAKLAGFLHCTARNLVLASFRKQGRRQTETNDQALAEIIDPAPSPLGRVLREEAATQVRRLIGELRTDRDRQVLLRFYIAEQEKEQICSDLGLSSLHFNRVLFRARQRLKNLMQRSSDQPRAQAQAESKV